MPFFSIIIPLYNKENFIENTLKSVMAQTFDDYEIILINDGSNDNSESIVLKHEDKRIRYFSKENQGVAITRNLGIKLAQSDFICFLDADDYWYPNFLEEIKYHIDKNSEQKVFATAIEIQTVKNIFPASYFIPKKSEFEIVDFFESSQKESIIRTSSSVFHKSVFETVGQFDESLKISEDTDLWIRIGMKYKIVFIWKILSRYVYDKKGVSRNFGYVFEDSFFEKFTQDELSNPKLKLYLDLNRFSAILKFKLIGEQKKAKKLLDQIDVKNLPLKKQFLLKLPSFCLPLLVKLKQLLADLGLGNSVFK
jgi:glycosyltransferase involved in cell wall biosynthesis